MVKLLSEDILTKDVLGWKGLHVFHFHLSSCSQKLRIFLNLKNVEWTSHHIDLSQGEQLSHYFLGINPRGLVPTLVHDGDVHIESNDIMLHLEQCFPDPPLIGPPQAEIPGLLKQEDDLHLDLRTITLRFMVDPDRSPRSAADLDAYATTGSGTIGGRPDHHKQREIEFWKKVENQGIDDDQACRSVRTFFHHLTEIDRRLDSRIHVLGDMLTIIDIAWLVSAQRLLMAGYPLDDLHPNIARWRASLLAHPSIGKELSLPWHIQREFNAQQIAIKAAGRSLMQTCDAIFDP